jgi:hypothetical protein
MRPHSPEGQGGSSEPVNIRILCRNHNRWAAEREYGRRHIDDAIAKRAAVATQ